MLFAGKGGADAKVFFKECFQLLNDGLFLLCAVPSAEAADWRHQLVDIGAHGFYFAFPEGVFQEFPCLLRLQLFFRDQLLQVRFPLLGHILVPFPGDIFHVIGLIKSYVNDEVFNMMESGEAAACVYYAGDYFIMADAQGPGIELAFYAPDSTNYFIDCMCIPSCCQHKELAEAWINYMCEYEPALANAEYICYGSPLKTIYEDETYQDDMGEEAMAILYPPDIDFAAKYEQFAQRNLNPETLDLINTLWEELKIN